MPNKTYIVSANDGTTEFDELVQNALARVLLEMSDRATGIVVTEVDVPIEKVSRNMEDGSVNIDVVDPQTRQLSHLFTEDEQKGVLRIGQLAQTAMILRDMVMTSLLGNVMQENSNEVDFDRTRDLSGEEGSGVATHH